MAFVYFEERFKEKGDLSKNQDGPGAYDDKPEPSPTQNLVPFLSSVPRHKETKRNSSLETPGPGAYSNVDPVATNRLETLELNLREKKIIINNSKPSSTFCSDSNRFPNEKKKLNVPGPGHYTYEVGGIALKASKSTKMLLEQPKGKNEFFIGNSMKLGSSSCPKTAELVQLCLRFQGATTSSAIMPKMLNQSLSPTFSMKKIMKERKETVLVQESMK